MGDGSADVRRGLLALAACLCGCLSLLQFAAQGDSTGPPTSQAGLIATPRQANEQLARGRELFAASCAACHGISAQGIPGRGPSLHGVGALAADFYLQTGRMPLASPRVQPQRATPAFPQTQIRALVAFVASFGGPPIPAVHPSRGSLSEGQRLFSLDCAGCHTIQGQGGVVTGAIVPSLDRATPRQVAQAIRIGPYVMPRFGEGELSTRQVDSLARFVQGVQHPEDRGGWGIGRIGPIPEGMVAWLLGAAALLLIARLLGERTPDRTRRGGERDG
jgi:ubiquinol-cytochrome c reductase cytochrome c subunit